MARSQSDTDSNSDSSTQPTPKLEPGDFAADREESEVVVVVDIHDEQADEYKIPALAGRTVAEVPSNSAYPADDTVVEVVYVSTLNYKLRKVRDMTWDTAKIVGMYGGDNLSRYDVRSYSVPASRLREVDT